MASRCVVCNMRSSSRWFLVSQENVKKCFDVTGVDGSSVRASCRRDLTRWKNTVGNCNSYFKKANFRGQKHKTKRFQARESRSESFQSSGQNESQLTRSELSSPLCSLPKHLLVDFFSFLAISDLPHLRLTCHYFNNSVRPTTFGSIFYGVIFLNNTTF